MTSREMGQTARRCRAAFVLLAVAASLVLPARAADHVERQYGDAVRSFRGGRTAEAFGQFVDLANRGDVDSARIALLMYMYGPTLFGRHWDAAPQDVTYWHSLVRNSGTSTRPPVEFPPTVLGPGKVKAKPLRVTAAGGSTGASGTRITQ